MTKSAQSWSLVIGHWALWSDGMDAATAAKPVKINRWLPYWAVFQADVRQTLRSWVYRTWVLMSVLAAVGYLLYCLGAYREAGLIQLDSVFISNLLRGTLI